MKTMIDLLFIVAIVCVIGMFVYGGGEEFRQQIIKDFDKQSSSGHNLDTRHKKRP